MRRDDAARLGECTRLPYIPAPADSASTSASIAMSIKSDRWIRRMAQEHGMIEPFEDRQLRQGVSSYGVSSYG